MATEFSLSGFRVVYSQWMAEDAVAFDRANSVVYVKNAAAAQRLAECMNEMEKAMEATFDAAILSMLGVLP